MLSDVVSEVVINFLLEETLTPPHTGINIILTKVSK